MKARNHCYTLLLDTTIIIIGVKPPTRSSSRIHRVSYRISRVPTRRRHHNIQGNIHICEAQRCDFNGKL